MKFSIRALMPIFFILLMTVSSFSQPPEMGMRMWREESPCWKASDLDLSQEQRKSLDLVQRTYYREIQLLRLQVFTKRLELRELLTNSAAKNESIRGKISEIIELQSKQEEKAAEYLIKVRNLLTPEQLRSWCPEQELPSHRQMMHGAGPMGPMRPRKIFPPPE
jgi:Spy/CpxP family protein refolding chaperone